MKKICINLFLAGGVLLVVFLLWRVMSEEETTQSIQNITPINTEKLAEESVELLEESEQLQEEEFEETVIETVKETVSVMELSARRLARNMIEISFNAPDVEVDTYYLLRKEVSDQKEEEWVICQEIKSNAEDTVYTVIDTLESHSLKQYEYCIDVKPLDEDLYVGQRGESILASNALVCIDPGHYEGKNKVTSEETYGYAEGDFTIKIGLALQEILKNEYGIDSYMTRNTSSITIGGYTDAALDKGHISLRGEYAGEQDSDLFISLHTNANNENANGYPTCLQPININKTIVLANMIACEREDIINIASSIGINISQINYEKGISVTDEFDAGVVDQIEEWTVEYNDSLNSRGSVRCRHGENGDYYGVLKGANRVGVPGIIVEHGMHTVAALRKEAMNSDLYKMWAEADAYGIAYGFGFESNIQMKE